MKNYETPTEEQVNESIRNCKSKEGKIEEVSNEEK